MMARSRLGAVAALALALVAILCLPGANAQAAPPADSDCLECHGDDETMSMARGGKTVSLYVAPGVLHGSAHAKVACIECHAGFDPEEVPHLPRIAPVDCMPCHKDAPSKHAFHAATVASELKTQGAASCKRCHGTHDVRPAAVSSLTKLGAADLSAACAKCHGEVVKHYEQSAHGRAAAAGVEAAPRCVTCHETAITGGAKPTAEQKMAQEKLCLSCHLDDPAVRARMVPTAGFVAAYEKSVHAAALREGKAESATCTDCHGSHEMAKGFEAESRSHKMHIPATCGACHEKIAKEFAGSVHATAVARGNLDSPVCTDCHGEHTILKAKDQDSPVAPANVSEKVCSPCHSSVKLMAKYGIRSDRFKTFSDSFHGLAIKGGSVSAANCASCHGSHGILPSKDPASMTHPARLAETCGECHAGATAAFASGKVHVESTEAEGPLLYWIGIVYTLLIAFTIGGMFVHNVFDFVRKANHRLRVRRGLAAGEPPVSHALYVRMTGSERIQHGLLVVSFTLLVVTGFALRYPEAWLFEAVRRFSAAIFEWRGILHRIAGVVLVAAGLFHIAYLTMTARGREFMRDIWPRPGDLGDVRQALRYYLGRTSERPRFGRFSYIEKSEYWALVWGTFVMAATGIVMWFQDPFIGLLTKLGWDAARTIHVYEAVLATLAIIVWHLYFVVFNPDVYPMNLAWIKGTLSAEEMREEHPLEFEEIERRKREEEARGATPPHDGGTE